MIDENEVKMSRWVEGFENHAFQASWVNVKNSLDEISIPAGTTAPNLKEYARLKKVVEYIDALLKASDPELIPLGVWNNFTGQSNNVNSQITNFNANNDFGHLTNANNYLDNLLTYISPYVRTGKMAAQTAGKAFKAYADTITRHIEKVETTAVEALTNTEQANESAQNLLSEIEVKKAEIDKLEQELLIGAEEEPSLKNRMESLENQTKAWHSKVSEFYLKLTKGNEEESSIILQIDEAKSKSLDNTEKTKQALDDSEKIIKELSSFNEEIFGKENDQGERIGGLKSEIDLRKDEISQFQEQQETKYSTLIDEIESLLPGATSAGLATAYNKLKVSYDDPIKNTTRMFYGSLIGLLIVGVVLITDKVGWFYIDFIEIDEASKLLNNILVKLPITIPLIWLAVFASKRRSQNMRLQQEYAHKEALAKSYQGFKKQIEGLGDDKDDILLKQLLQAAIEGVSFNASGTLDGKHGDKVPIIDDAEGLVKVIKASLGK